MFLETDPDFAETGLKRSSVVRISHLAVVDKGLLLGSLGKLSSERFGRLQARLCQWVCGTA
jgi:mRNA interferase MazF